MAETRQMLLYSYLYTFIMSYNVKKMDPSIPPLDPQYDALPSSSPLLLDFESGGGFPFYPPEVLMNI